ncbi:hypothetical protein D9757_010405 [Collybiopsis confluens]|uniref:Uncharacterized protein n=1 Tax=Collybiopsis confluens TaxID=2823264 RepID=A0A8H5GP67_9AGAR|nr:hypothetical protein D9757_013224 [Collybiopsis confluens]KAF5368733.1 hypothetical protein D9757_010405 [Collybiopsis confluens]
MTLNSEEEHQHAVILLYHSGHVIAVIPQTFVYGIYAVLIPVSSYIMLHRGLATRERKILFGTTIFMFLLSTAYWIASISTLIQLIQVWFLAPDPDAGSPPNYLPFFNAAVLVNYILTDGVVVWRAWVLCSSDGKKTLMMCLFMLGLGTVSVIATIGIRIALLIINTQAGDLFDRLNHGINVTQVATLIMSVLTNSLATSLISVKAWKCRLEIRDDLDGSPDGRSRAGKVFALLIETGVLYTLSCITVLVSTVIPLKEGTLGDLYTPVNTQLAGIYPVVVLLLVTQNQSLDRTTPAFSSGIVVQSGSNLTAFTTHSSHNNHNKNRQLESTMRFEKRRTAHSISGMESDESSDFDYVGNSKGQRIEHIPGHNVGDGKRISYLPPIPSSEKFSAMCKGVTIGEAV